MYIRGVHQTWCGQPKPLSATPSALNKTGRDTAETKVKTARGPAMEEMMCAMALKSSIGRHTHHIPSGLRVCRERALKSAGERNTNGGVSAGTFGKPPARGTLGASTTGIQRRFAIWRRGLSPAGCWYSAVCVLGERLRRSQLAALATS
jgi:hypothetical protein